MICQFCNNDLSVESHDEWCLIADVGTIEIPLIESSVKCLDRLAKTGMTRTDIINRAIQLYDLIEEGMLDGKKLALIREGSSEIEVLHLS